MSSTLRLLGKVPHLSPPLQQCGCGTGGLPISKVFTHSHPISEVGYVPVLISLSRRLPSPISRFWEQVPELASTIPSLDFFNAKVLCSPSPLESWSQSCHQSCLQPCGTAWQVLTLREKHDVRSRETAAPQFPLLCFLFVITPRCTFS